MVWFTSVDVDCGGDWLQSCSIFLLDLMNTGQSLVRWLVSFPWYMQYGSLNGPHP
jgi:hypothetical protein